MNTPTQGSPTEQEALREQLFARISNSLPFPVNPDEMRLMLDNLMQLFARQDALSRIDELERTRSYDDMDDTDKHVEVERCIVNRLAQLRHLVEKGNEGGR